MCIRDRYQRRVRETVNDPKKKTKRQSVFSQSTGDSQIGKRKSTKFKLNCRLNRLCVFVSVVIGKMASSQKEPAVRTWPEENRIGVKHKLDPHHDFIGPFMGNQRLIDKDNHLPVLGIGVYNGFVYLNDSTVTDSKKLKEHKDAKLVAHYISTEPEEVFESITNINLVAYVPAGYKVVPCYVVNANSQSAFDEPESTPFPSKTRGIEGLAKAFPNLKKLKLTFPFTIWASYSCRGSCLQPIRASRHNLTPAIIPACFETFKKLEVLKIEVFEPTTDEELLCESKDMGRSMFGSPWTITTLVYERKVMTLVDFASKFLSGRPEIIRNIEELPTELQEKIEKYKKRRVRDWDDKDNDD
eukprot:TRINITY_DN3885_c0_g1_i4.p1 TRINITY_DN3885_c0_g1~~TRINITY_DN3885_c0_g1_i4.p1  ORF type:complete len:356 (-),score=66.31 TRINITY_DN3885_c0_g1_i4:182-1249(-)